MDGMNATRMSLFMDSTELYVRGDAVDEGISCSNGKYDPSPHPLLSIGENGCGARQRRRKEKNVASKTSLEDMAKVVYHVLDKNLRKQSF